MEKAKSIAISIILASVGYWIMTLNILIGYGVVIFAHYRLGKVVAEMLRGAITAESAKRSALKFLRKTMIAKDLLVERVKTRLDEEIAKVDTEFEAAEAQDGEESAIECPEVSNA